MKKSQRNYAFSNGDSNTVALTLRAEVARLRPPKPEPTHTTDPIKSQHATADEVLLRLADHLRGDLADVYRFIDDEGRMDWEAAKRAGVSHLVKRYRRKESRGGGYSLTLELHDSQKAAFALARIVGLLNGKNAHIESVATPRIQRFELLKRLDHLAEKSGDKSKL